MNPRAAVLSDLHLTQKPSARNKAFLDFLARLPQLGLQELWLLGDIYDLFIGPYEFWRRMHARLFEGLEGVTRAGMRVLWIEGNHDFHLARLLEEAGVECRDGLVERRLGERRIFLAHGDQVNTGDRAYLRWRAFTRSGLFRGVMTRIPDPVAERFLVPLGERLSHGSRARDRYDPSLRELYRAYARERFGEGFDAVMMGHCHMAENLEENGRIYFNMGSWFEPPFRAGLYDASENRVELRPLEAIS